MGTADGGRAKGFATRNRRLRSGALQERTLRVPVGGGLAEAATGPPVPPLPPASAGSHAKAQSRETRSGGFGFVLAMLSKGTIQPTRRLRPRPRFAPPRVGRWGLLTEAAPRGSPRATGASGAAPSRREPCGCPLEVASLRPRRDPGPASAGRAHTRPRRTASRLRVFIAQKLDLTQS
jgi:hypothetical protein